MNNLSKLYTFVYSTIKLLVISSRTKSICEGLCDPETIYGKISFEAKLGLRDKNYIVISF